MAVEPEVLVGSSVAGAIVRTVSEHADDLIVMSSEAHTGARRAILGSVTDAVVRSAECPVLVIRRAAANAQPREAGQA
jgi:nucleotide-binding universal stress UspA family protein